MTTYPGLILLPTNHKKRRALYRALGRPGARVGLMIRQFNGSLRPMTVDELREGK